MSDFVVQAIVSILEIAVALAAAYVFGRRGLFTRMMLFIAPLTGVSCYASWFVGHYSSATSLVLLNGSVFAAGVVTIVILHKQVVSRLQTQVSSLTSSINQIASAAKQAAATAAEQASTVAQVTTTVGEINQISSVASETAQQVLSAASTATERGQSGLGAVAEAIRVMDRIKQVGEIVEMVNDLSEQSNLLAVNAAIEAAKAGDHGRGFAVVATEVRSLAERSKEATRQIREAIRRTEDGKRAIDSVQSVIRDLAQVLAEAADRARQISGATVQQAAGMRQISEAMSNVSQGGQDNAAAANQLERTANDLMGVGQQLRTLVSG